MRRDNHWRAPEELVEIGFDRSRVLMMNEAHDGRARCIRTRQIGQHILPVAHHLDVRHLAMEALWKPALADEANQSRKLPENTGTYLDQPEMRTFVTAALALGWTLIAYEADPSQELVGLSERATINWREERQARNLATALDALPSAAKVLVWCGNGHLMKRTVRMHPAGESWIPMGYHFRKRSGTDPFAIDQTKTVFSPPLREQVQMHYATKLTELGGTAGFLRKETPLRIRAALGKLSSADAFLLSLDNALV